ncbi:nickel-dependent hydrogenase large subunit [Eggerthella sp. YY7918]|uniref:nickel-dependent hydrogenase large subunit n=1 Tax=Eggerthella sp. (strain YY7918) TaxID=502558 RepID=UPI00021715DF|nr:nickel-dependent hydrogenase large subunit [Eggerthella sp. YY7918]BAK44398.1 Ni,Fe-hydrogenase I large subunit [Eggerthella sp. YY7918]
MTRSVIDPITRIEGHLRVEMEVTNGKVSDAWVSGGCFRGMEMVVENRTPEDAAQIVQRICGVCPVSHAHSSTIAAEKAYGIQISNNARIIRNLIEGAQFLHSHILWFYNLAALDYVNPLNALEADPMDAIDLAKSVGTSVNSDFVALQDRLKTFASNGQLSIFSGNWFDAEDGTGYTLLPELDLICTAHYLEALSMQAKASQISALLGGKMPHVMTIVPGGTAFVPTAQKLDDLKYLVDEIYNWVEATMIPDTLAIAPFYMDALNWGKGCGRYVAWGVFEGAGEYSDYTEQMKNRYLPMGVLDDNLNISDVQENLITEYVGHSWYKGEETYTSPYYTTEPEYTTYDVNDRYTWCKCPAYDGKCYEAGGLSRVLAAYKRNVPFVVDQVNGLLEALGAPGQISAAQSTLGRTAVRQIETLYIAGLMKEWVGELCEAVKSGDSEYFRAPETITGGGTGFWEAPRGALYHHEEVQDGKITGYQIIIPTTWNIAPHDASGEPGPMEQALIGVPVGDVEKPINALRTVHSFDPCTACAVHITEPATGKSFETVTSPWGVK